MAPLVADGKVLVGNSGGEMGVRGWIAALDEGSGKLAWKAYQHRPRQGRADRPATSSRSIAIGPGQGPRRQDLAAGRLEDRRRHGLGLDQLRSRDCTLIYYGTGNPGPWNPDQRPGRQQVDDRRLRPRRRHRRRRAGSTSRPRTTCSTTTTSTRSSSPTCRGNGRAAGHRSGPRATASSTSSTAAPARCCPPTPYGYVNAYKGVDLKTGRIIPNHEKDPQGRPRRARHLPGGAGRQGLEPVGVQPASPASSTSRTTTCAWTIGACRRTTSPARRTSAPT